MFFKIYKKYVDTRFVPKLYPIIAGYYNWKP